MSLPLEGVKIADFSWVGAGPRATKDLADYGATVVKVESARRLDLGRLSPPFKDGKPDPDGSAFFAITNTSKLGVTINLADPRGIEVARRLIGWADVVVENFSKGYMERLGLDYASLSADRPDLIMLSVSVAGRTGPMSDLRGYGNSAAALSGLAALSGWPDTPPHMPPFAYGDVVAPMFGTLAVLAALEHRRVAGEGRHIDVSQVEPLIHVMADAIVEAQLEPAAPKPANSSPALRQGVFPARGHDQWVAIAIRDEADQRRLDELTGGAELATWTAGQDKHLLADRLTAAGVPCEAVFDGRDVFTDPELIESGHFVPIEHAVLGRCDMPAPPVRFSRSGIRVTPPPRLGEHNRPVFEGFLGMTPAEIDTLSAAGVLA